MTETLQRPSGSSPGPRRPRPTEAPRGLVVDGVLTAVRTALLGLLLLAVPVLLVWAADDRAGAGSVEALRTAGQLWLVAHTAPLEVPGGAVGLTPLGLVALPLLLLVRTATRRSQVRSVASVGEAGRLALAIAVPYALLGLLVGVASATDDVRTPLLSCLSGPLLVGLAGAWTGALRPSRLWRAAWLRVPARGRRLLRAALNASAVLAGGGALLVGASLALHLPQAADLAAAGAPGVGGGLALLVLGIALVPNAVVWGAAWLAGPGFAVGVGTAVGPFGHELGAVPAVPLLAALPGSGVATWVGLLALVVPLAGGALAGRSVEGDPGLGDAGLVRAALEAAAAGPVCGLLWLVVAWTSGGPLGGERLVDVGPSPWAVGLAVTGLVAVPAALTALVARRRRIG